VRGSCHATAVSTGGNARVTVKHCNSVVRAASPAVAESTRAGAAASGRRRAQGQGVVDTERGVFYYESFH